jgi:ribosome biogenesis GTPase A
MTRVEYHAIETENDVLRSQLRDLRAAATTMVESVEKYVRQEESRTILLNKKDALKKLLRR